VLVTVYAVDAEHLRAALAGVLDADSEHAVELVHLQRAEALMAGRDHFGFFDGISQPALQGSGVAPRPGDGQPDGNGGWRQVATGEVLLGYRDEDGTLPAAPGPPFEKNGTYVVYRKLAMDVAAFRRYVAEQGERYPGGARLLAAKIVGRWPDGTPLAVSPDRPDAKLSSDSARINDFGYSGDPAGVRCPLGAHIRRTNPRDAKGFFDGRLSNRHRIVRRGRAYGRPLPAGMEDDGADRGLVFVCFQADIWRQFETIQSLWVDDGDPFGLGRDKDFLIGEPHGTDGKMTIQGNPPFFLKPQPRFVTTRGGEYLFQPSMSALRRLSGVG
jgi:Dyp-type peroxidase family